eukprot:gene19287-29718_t
MEVACESPAAAVEQSVEKVREKMSRTAYDLEVSLLMGALRSMRKTAVLNPFPKAFVEGVERRYDLLQMAAQTLPPADQLYEGDASELNASLSPNARQLLSFLVNNSNLKEVPVGPAIKGLISEKDNPSLVPQKVFEVSLGPRAKEFDEAALQYGVRVGYHGSAVGNWFCISKMGLFNFSGTQKQATGSLFGEGIYLAKTPRLACDFSSRGECWKESEKMETAALQRAASEFERKRAAWEARRQRLDAERALFESKCWADRAADDGGRPECAEHRMQLESRLAVAE